MSPLPTRTRPACRLASSEGALHSANPCAIRVPLAGLCRLFFRLYSGRLRSVTSTILSFSKNVLPCTVLSHAYCSSHVHARSHLQVLSFLHARPAMQSLWEFLTRWFCTCGARDEHLALPILSQVSTQPQPISPSSTPPSNSSSPVSITTSAARRVIASFTSPSHVSSRSPSSAASSSTQLPPPAQSHQPQVAPLSASPSASTDVPTKAPPPRPPPSISPTDYQARSSASSSQQAQPPHYGPLYAKAPPPGVYQIHASQIERRLGLHWAGYAFLTFPQYSEGWQTWYTDDYSMVFFYNRATGTSRWSPPPSPDDTEAGGSTGGT